MRKLVVPLVLLGVLAAVIVLSQNSSTPTLRIAYVDLEKVTESYYKWQELNEKYKRDYSFYQSKLKEMEDELKRLQERGASQAEIQKKQEEILARKTEYENVLRNEYQPKIQEVINEVVKKISEYASVMRYNLVLIKQNVVLYGDPALDITQQVIAYINSGKK